MYGVVIVLIVILAILLILVVLAQNPKGGGLSSQFGGSGTTQLMGVKKTGDLLEKLTWGFAIAILVLAVVTNFIQPVQEEEILSSPNIDNAQSTSAPALPATEIDNNLMEDISAESAENDTTN